MLKNNLKNGKVEFNSIDEAKEFLQDSIDDPKCNGFIGYGGKKISLKEFVQDVGLDTAAEVLYNSQGSMSAYEFGMEEFMDLMKAYINDPESISEAEKEFADEIMQMYIKNSSNVEQIAETLLRELYKTPGNIYSSISGIFTFLLTFMEMVLGYSMKGYEDNNIRKDAMERIRDSIVENGVKNIQPEILPFGLLQCFGESIITPYFEGVKFDYEGFAEQYNLDIGTKKDDDTDSSAEISSLSKEVEKIMSDSKDSGTISFDKGKSSARERMKKKT